MPSKRHADRTFVGHRLTPEARRALDEFERAHSGITEGDLFRGYGRLIRHRPSVAQEPLERPETAVYDESGLAYGEPISEGRTDGTRRRSR